MGTHVADHQLLGELNRHITRIRERLHPKSSSASEPPSDPDAPGPDYLLLQECPPGTEAMDVTDLTNLGMLPVGLKTRVIPITKDGRQCVSAKDLRSFFPDASADTPLTVAGLIQYYLGSISRDVTALSRQNPELVKQILHKHRSPPSASSSARSSASTTEYSPASTWPDTSARSSASTPEYSPVHDATISLSDPRVIRGMQRMATRLKQIAVAFFPEEEDLAGGLDLDPRDFPPIEPGLRFGDVLMSFLLSISDTQFDLLFKHLREESEESSHVLQTLEEFTDVPMSEIRWSDWDRLIWTVEEYYSDLIAKTALSQEYQMNDCAVQLNDATQRTDSAAQRIAQLDDEIKECRNSLESMTTPEEANRLRSQLAQLERERDEATTFAESLRKEFSSRLQEAEREIAEEKRRLKSQLQDAKEQFRTQMEAFARASEADKAELLQRVQESENEVRRITEALEQQVHEERQHGFDLLQKEVAKKDADSKSRDARWVAALTKRSKELQTQVETVQTALKSCRVETEETQRTNDDLANRLQVAGREFAEEKLRLESQLRDAKEQFRTSMEAFARASETGKAELLQRVQESEDEVRRLVGKLEDATASFEEDKARVLKERDELQTQLETARTAFESCRAKAEETLSTLREQFEREKEALTLQYSSDRKSLEAEIETLRSNYAAQSRSETEECQRRIAETQNELIARKAEYQSTLADLNAQLNYSQNQCLARLKAQTETHRERIATLQKQIEGDMEFRHHGEIDELRRAIAETKEQADSQRLDLLQRLDECDQSSHEGRTRIQELERALEQQEAERTTRLKELREQMNVTLDRLRTERERSVVSSASPKHYNDIEFVTTKYRRMIQSLEVLIVSLRDMILLIRLTFVGGGDLTDFLHDVDPWHQLRVVVGQGLRVFFPDEQLHEPLIELKEWIERSKWSQGTSILAPFLNIWNKYASTPLNEIPLDVLETIGQEARGAESRLRRKMVMESRQPVGPPITTETVSREFPEWTENLRESTTPDELVSLMRSQLKRSTLTAEELSLSELLSNLTYVAPFLVRLGWLRQKVRPMSGGELLSFEELYNRGLSYGDADRAYFPSRELRWISEYTGVPLTEFTPGTDYVNQDKAVQAAYFALNPIRSVPMQELSLDDIQSVYESFDRELANVVRPTQKRREAQPTSLVNPLRDVTRRAGVPSSSSSTSFRDERTQQIRKNLAGFGKKLGTKSTP